MGSFCRDVCGFLERHSGTRFALPARHHRSMSCPTLAPTELVYVCTVQVLFPLRGVGIAPPPISFFCFCTVQVLFPTRSTGKAPPPPIEGLGGNWDCELSLHVAGHPEESMTLLRLMGVASSRLLLISACAIDAWPTFHGTPMIGCHLVN